MPALKRDFLLSHLEVEGKEDLLDKAAELLETRKKKYPWENLSDEVANDICQALEKNIYPKMPTLRELKQKREAFAVAIADIDTEQDIAEEKEKLLIATKELKSVTTGKNLRLIKAAGLLYSKLATLEGSLEKQSISQLLTVKPEMLETAKSEIFQLGDELKNRLAQFYSIWGGLNRQDRGNTAMKVLPFYQDGDNQGLLIHVDNGDARKNMRFVWLPERQGIHILLGKSDTMHLINMLKGVLNLSGEGFMEEYLRFFCDHLCGEEGLFNIIEEAPVSPDGQISINDILTPRTEDLRHNSSKMLDKPYKAEITLPITRIDQPEADKTSEMMVANVVYGALLFRVMFSVNYAKGEVGMLEDHPVNWCALSPLNTSWESINSVINDIDYDDAVNSIRSRYPEASEHFEEEEAKEEVEDVEDVVEEEVKAQPKEASFLDVPAEKWRLPSDEEKSELIKALEQMNEEEKNIAHEIGRGADVAFKNLPFYDETVLVCVVTDQFIPGQSLRFLFDKNESEIAVLDGGSAVIHELNSADKLNINEQSALEYLRFFCEHVQGEEGSFYPIENLVDTSEYPDFPAVLDISAVLIDGTEEDRVMINQNIMLEIGENNEYQADSTIHYGSAVFNARFNISDAGYIEMMSDTSIDGAALNLVGDHWYPVTKEAFSHKGEGE